MTKQEEKSLNDLKNLLDSIRIENNKFREDIKNQVGKLEEATKKKHLPISLEQDILTTAQQSIQKAISESLGKYDSPMIKLVNTVISEHSVELKELISSSFSQVIRAEDFKQSIISAFSHKVAKTIISNNDGLFDKVSNDLKQDSIFKAKMSIAVSNVVEECLKESNKTGLKTV